MRSEARAMLRLVGVAESDIYANEQRVIDEHDWQRLRAIVKRRCAGEPLAYIEGRRGFHQIELEVSQDVLVPRPETEMLVDAVLARMPRSEFCVADLGTGSGAIALAIAHAAQAARVVGVDISAAALQVARKNARLLGLDVEWIESDWFSALGTRRFDFICCNPPYVCSNDPHLEALRHEPLLALDGGDDGLAAIRRVLGDCASHMKAAGCAFLEHGFDQAAAIAPIAAESGLTVTEVLRDLAGHERISVLRVTE